MGTYTPEIQLPLFPARTKEGLSGRALLREFPNSPSWVICYKSNGPAMLYYIELLGVWVVSRAAGIHGPSGHVAVTIQYVFREVFLLKEMQKAIRFGSRVAEPFLDQDFHYVMGCIRSRRPIGPYHGHEYD